MMQNHLDDQAVLVDALDRWFAILRKRLGAPVPLKPASRSAIQKLGQDCGVTVPPDVVTLYEYTNGAWLNEERRISAFLPSSIYFAPLPSPPRSTYSWVANLDDSGDWSWSGYLPPEVSLDESRQSVPVFSSSGGEQVFVIAGDRCRQAVAFIGVDGMRWIARRLADVFEIAVALETADLLEWSPAGVEYRDDIYAPFPRWPDEVRGPYLGWAWEDLAEVSS